MYLDLIIKSNVYTVYHDFIQRVQMPSESYSKLNHGFATKQVSNATQDELETQE